MINIIISKKNSVSIPDFNWNEYLEKRLIELLSNEGIDFDTLKPSFLTETEGVYLITKKSNPKREEVYYIGRTKKLR